jgi:hypothetical protein
MRRPAARSKTSCGRVGPRDLNGQWSRHALSCRSRSFATDNAARGSRVGLEPRPRLRSPRPSACPTVCSSSATIETVRGVKSVSLRLGDSSVMVTTRSWRSREGTLLGSVLRRHEQVDASAASAGWH